jgi:hypothetical protein
MGVSKKYYSPHKHTFDAELVFRQNNIPVQAFQTNIVKKRLALINEENLKNVMALQHYFPVRPKNTFNLLGQCSPVRLLKARTKLTLGSISHTMTVCSSKSTASIALVRRILSGRHTLRFPILFLLSLSRQMLG